MRETKELKKIKGITLIALVITIIILLILSGITITSLTNAGLLTNTKEAKQISNYTFDVIVTGTQINPQG